MTDVLDIIVSLCVWMKIYAVKQTLLLYSAVRSWMDMDCVFFKKVPIHFIKS